MSDRKLKLAPYFRVSSQTQKNEETIHRQIENFNNNWGRLKSEYQILTRFPFLDQKQPGNRYFIDEGYNLETWNEDSACHDLMSRCKRGEVNAIFVSELDRLCRSRSAELRGRIKDILEARDVKVITKTGEVPPGILFELLSSVSAEDKRAIMLKCQEGKITWCEREGRPPSGKIPYGYDWDRFTRKWTVVLEEVTVIRCALGLVIGKVFEDMPSEIAALARAHPLGLPTPDVVRALNMAGYNMKAYYHRNHLRRSLEINPTGTMRNGFISAIFQDDRYRGNYVVWLKEPRQIGREEFKDLAREMKRKIVIKVPRIIDSDDDWKELKARRLSRKVHAKRNVNHPYLLRDLLVCSLCGIKLSARPKWGRKLRKTDGKWSEYAPTLYYVCTRKLKADGFRCSATRCHAAPKADALVWNEVVKLVLDPELISAAQVSTTNLSPAPSLEGHESDLEELAKKCNGLNQERQRLTTLLVKELISESDFVKERERIEDEVHSMEKLQRTIRRQIEVLKKSLLEAPAVDLDKLRNSIFDRLQVLTFDEKREVVTTLLDRATLSPSGTIRISLRPMTKQPIASPSSPGRRSIPRS